MSTGQQVKLTLFEKARMKYKPDTIRYLLIAEAPPEFETGRFFYFENVPDHDALFLETIKVLYPKDWTNVKDVRKNKREFLERFKRDGFYLIDSTDIPMTGKNSSVKKKIIEGSYSSLEEKVRLLVSRETKVILLTSTVFNVCNQRLRSAGFNVINDTIIPYPLRWQNQFRDRLSRLLLKHGWNQ